MTTAPEAMASDQTTALPEEPPARHVVQTFDCNHRAEYSPEGSSCP